MDPVQNPVVDLTVTALRQAGATNLGFFEKLLERSFAEHSPAFAMRWYGDSFRDQALSPRWLAQSLLTNAEKEGEGARALWSMAARTSDSAIAEEIKRHAVDESNHARYYLAMLKLTFPDCVTAEMQPKLNAISPGYVHADVVEPNLEATEMEVALDELVQMNIGEIRTRVHQLMLQPVLMAYCHPERRQRLLKLLTSIIADETRHIAYTAVILERAAHAGYAELIERIMFGRLAQFCALTLREVGERKFSGA